MRLRSLRLHGFKSFADRTSLEFRDGITAIVGSNGCGKSNLADAVRWVLGEQRASAIRGAKMDEVIFQGTVRRRPLNFAEVALHFSNEEGRVEIPQSEIEIARKTFREGGSEYSVNRAACRLRDIHALLRGTGVGTNAYTVIESTMIDTLLSDRAEERRSLFEEAAGIGRYKDSRRATTRRLEAAEADLDRLGDLIAEVESKVRSLARQRRRAQRLQQLRDRRLSLEVALARAELVALETSLTALTSRAADLRGTASGVRREREAAESATAERRAARSELSAQRASAAQRLDDLRTRLHGREREVVVARERRANAELRIGQLVRERGEQEQRVRALRAEADGLAAEVASAVGLLDEARRRLETCTEGGAGLRAELDAERQRADALAGEARRMARDRASLNGEVIAQRMRHQQAVQQAERIRAQMAVLGAELGEHAAQTELWAAEAVRLRDRLDAVTTASEQARAEVAGCREREAARRAALREADDRASRLAAQVDAREAVERSYEGFAPAVPAISAAADRWRGAHGPLADFIDTAGLEPGVAAAAEAYLGPLLHAVVVADTDTARRLRDWFRDEWQGGGSLWLLPLDAPGLREPRRSLPAITGRGAGAPWVERLLAGVRLDAAADPLASVVDGAVLANARGEVADARGVVRLVERLEGEGILVRRERLAVLRQELEAARVERDLARERLDAARTALADVESRARDAAELRRATAAELQRVEADAAAQSRRQDRLDAERVELNRALKQQEESLREAVAEGRALGVRAAEVEAALAAVEADASAARERLASLEAGWETTRDEETEHRLAVARAETELRDLERRRTAALTGAAAAADRIGVIDAEAAELRSALESLTTTTGRLDEEVRELTAARDAHAAAVAALDSRVADAEREGEAAEAQAERLRRLESDQAEERHRLELETSEARSRSERVRERLEAEWGQPWHALAGTPPPEDGDADAWTAELRAAVAEIESLGPVNLLAVEEHAEESRRLEFLLEQRDDLVAARDDLAAAIRQINRTAREVFVNTFASIRANFQRTFHSLFQGGECEVWLADPDDPLESPIEIQASPLGKRTQRIHLLSGGERTLTALALLFAIYLVKPSPFCVLDEVDAPLDESNVGRFVQLLQDFKAETQFLVITHNTRTMESADWVHGVTMEEHGVSSVVSVQLEGVWRDAGRVA